MQSTVDFAILAPVPEEHLESGLDLLRSQDFVAFGSLKWELFEEIDRLRGGEPVPALIYPSDQADVPHPNYVIQWTGWYIEHVRSQGGVHPNGKRNRPESTEQYAGDQGGYWAVFWHVAELRKLEEEEFRPISSLQSYKSGDYWKAGHPPRGPEIVARPSWI